MFLGLVAVCTPSAGDFLTVSSVSGMARQQTEIRIGDLITQSIGAEWIDIGDLHLMARASTVSLGVRRVVLPKHEFIFRVGTREVCRDV